MIDIKCGFEIVECPVYKHYELWYKNEKCASGYSYGEMCKIRDDLISKLSLDNLN